MPTPTFYSLPTRCWELLIGYFVAFHTSTATIGATPKPTLQETLSLTGVGLILVSIFTFTKNTPSPSIPTLAPTVGTALVILYANEGTITYKLLANRLRVGIGLISYSLYLWHYPLFAFAKIYSITPPAATTMLLCCIATLIISTLSWRFIEIPFRNKSKIGRHFIPYSIAASLVFIGFGYYLYISHGVPTRMYNDKATISADMYISYNERAFKFKKDTFDNTSRLNILVIGNSYARDFVNMTLENFDLDGIEIIYRDDLPECMQLAKSETFDKLYSSTNIIVFANDHAKLNCVDQNITKALKDGKNIFYLGTKHFGYNLNWLARLNPSQRRNKFNPPLPETAEEEAIMSNAIPKENLIDILSVININGLVPITDEMGQLISEDRTHLTRQGAIYVGKRALVKSKFGEILNAAIR